MPGWNIRTRREKAINKLFDEGGILFAHGFTNQEKYHVREFEELTKNLKQVFFASIKWTSAMVRSLSKTGDEVV